MTIEPVPPFGGLLRSGATGTIIAVQTIPKHFGSASCCLTSYVCRKDNQFCRDMANRNVTMNTLDCSSAWMWELKLVLGVSVVIGHRAFNWG